MMAREDLKQKIYDFVKSIPKGKVATYRQVAAAVGLKFGAQLYVGNVLHQNTDPVNIPCHRVIFSDGHVADNYAFGGRDAQIKRLKEEGVKFILDKVDLKACLFDVKAC